MPQSSTTRRRLAGMPVKKNLEHEGQLETQNNQAILHEYSAVNRHLHAMVCSISNQHSPVRTSTHAVRALEHAIDRSSRRSCAVFPTASRWAANEAHKATIGCEDLQT